MSTTLVVVRPFGSHAKGDAIADAAAIAAILASEQASNVVRVVSSTPAPTTPAAQPNQGG
jgi:hypothetical protein